MRVGITRYASEAALAIEWNDVRCFQISGKILENIYIRPNQPIFQNLSVENE